jgi:hypothetical protein
MGISIVKDIAIILGSIIALFSFANGILEYIRQGAQKRVEQFVLLRRRLKENPAFSEICSFLVDDDKGLATVPPQDKRDFLGLLEEVALLSNSGLIRKDVAHYMFGYYAVRCLESKNFWQDIERDSIYWRLFHDFAGEMQVVEQNFRYKRRKLRF